MSGYEGSYGEDSRGHIDSEFLKHVNNFTNETHHLFSQASEEEMHKPMQQMIQKLPYQNETRYILRAQSCNDRWFIQELTEEDYKKIYMQNIGLGPLASLAEMLGGAGIGAEAPNSERLRKIMEAADSISEEEMADVTLRKAKRDSKDDEGMEAVEEELVSEDQFKQMMEGSS